MKRSGGIVGILGGASGLVVAALITSFVGGYVTFPFQGGSFPEKYEWFGWGAIFCSLLAIVVGVAAKSRPRVAGILLIALSIIGALLATGFVPAIGIAGAATYVACIMLSMVGGILAVTEGSKTCTRSRHKTH